MSFSNIMTASSAPPRVQDPRMALHNITTASSAQSQIQSAASIQAPIPRQVWYCCQCLIGRKGNPPVAHEMNQTECGFPDPNPVARTVCHHPRCDASCLIQRGDEGPPMWCLGLTHGLVKPPWAGFPWKSYEPFRRVLRDEGPDVWPAWWCCKCSSAKANDQQSCRNRVKGKVCWHGPCGGCSPDGRVPGNTPSPPPPRGPPKARKNGKPQFPGQGAFALQLG